MKKQFISACCAASITATSSLLAQKLPSRYTDEELTRRADSVMALMTLEEKVGQLHQVSSAKMLTGPDGTTKVTMEDEIRAGRVGSVLNLAGATETRRIQKIAVEESRLKIPLIFGLDVIHGYKTLFPIPLAEAASWDVKLMERNARIAAIEAAASGLHWTFAPMVDIARDPRWGRVAEGAGEDVFLGKKAAEARVKGFQGDDLADNNTIMACAKHFAGYGFVEQGKDYNTTTISERVMRETVLPPFEAATKAGVATFMNAFNDYNGVPASANQFLTVEILRKTWGFRGFIVSDWNSIGEMITWGTAADKADAARQAINAGSDMDMMGYCYIQELINLVRTGKVEETKVNESVRRILRLKFALGLFDDPFAYCSETREKELLFHPEHIKAAREAATKSMVLLKNEKNLLPLKKDIKNVLITGKLGGSARDMAGCWQGGCSHVKDSFVCSHVSLYEGIAAKIGANRVKYAFGADTNTDSTKWLAQAVNMAKSADVVIVVVGEDGENAGEGRSYTDITLSGGQKALVEAIAKTGKPIVLTIVAGRPLVFTPQNKIAQSVVYAWHAGTQAGNAFADLIFGDANFSAKLPITIPYSQGQIPIHYAMKNTGRPYWSDVTKKQRYISGFEDAPTYPLYHFGYGLSYTTFSYGEPKLSTSEMTINDTLFVTVDVTNTGKIDGEEIVQLYLQDVVASVTRPLKELKAFEKVLIKAGETKKITFPIVGEDLKIWDKNMNWTAEPGEFKVMVGTSSHQTQAKSFVLK